MTEFVSRTDIQAKEERAPLKRASISLGDVAQRFGLVLADGIDPNMGLIGGAALEKATAAITDAVIGRGVFIHRGVQIGQDGFWVAVCERGPIKVTQLGKVIIGTTSRLVRAKRSTAASVAIPSLVPEQKSITLYRSRTTSTFAAIVSSPRMSVSPAPPQLRTSRRPATKGRSLVIFASDEAHTPPLHRALCATSEPWDAGWISRETDQNCLPRTDDTQEARGKQRTTTK